MYKSYYNLRRNPFEITPDPEFLFATKGHNEALAALYYGIRWRKGFVVLTGQVGTGKTLLLRCLLQLLKQSKDVAYAYLFNSRLCPTEFLQYIVRDLGMSSTAKTKGELLFDLCHFVVNRNEKNLTTLLIVDEAHHLSTEVLEEIRLLTNLETAQHKMLQIVLIGQPELDGKLDSAGMVQLKQRVAVRCHLKPLDCEETKGYIERRMQLVTASSDAAALFPMATVGAIHHYSGGIPRLINTICENALIAAYVKQLPAVTPNIIDAVAKDLRLEVCLEDSLPVAMPEEMDVQQAARILLDLYAALHKTPTRETQLHAPVSVRMSQA
ncbi:MAG: AAA family ATPase [Acidobacteria bacterium]|nr:AAA family ATPase [Acidobacteriota bacterium]